MIFHRLSFFPLTLALLTLALALLMFYAFMGTPRSTPRVVEQSVTPVSEKDYQEEMRVLTSTFVKVYQAETNPSARVQLVDQTLSSLLALRVPVQYKDVHLTFAVTLNQLRGNEQTFDAFIQIVQEQSWLAE